MLHEGSYCLGGFSEYSGWIIYHRIPAFILKILHVNRNNLGVFEVRRYFGGLYNGFRLRVYFWEVVIMLRKMIIVGSLYLYLWLGAAAQIPVLLMVLFAFMTAEIHVSPYAWAILRNAERCSLAVQIISVFFFNLFQSKYFQSDERRWGIESIIGTLNIGYSCCLIVYIFYFQGFFHCSGHSKNPEKHAEIQLIANPLRNLKGDDPASHLKRRLTIRRQTASKNPSKNTDIHWGVNPIRMKTNEPKTSGQPVRHSSTIV